MQEFLTGPQSCLEPTHTLLDISVRIVADASIFKASLLFAYCDFSAVQGGRVREAILIWTEECLIKLLVCALCHSHKLHNQYDRINFQRTTEKIAFYFTYVLVISSVSKFW